MRFLDESKKDSEAEQRAKEEARKRELEQARALANAEKQRAEIQKRSAKRNKVFALILFVLACIAVFMAFEADTAKKQAQNNLSYSVAESADKMSMERLPQKALAYMAAESGKNPNIDYFSQKIKSTLDHSPFLNYGGKIFELGSEAKVRWFLGSQCSPDLTYYAAAHDETDNSFFKIVDTENRQTVFESEKYKQIEGLRFSSDSKFLIVAAIDLNGSNVADIIALEAFDGIMRIEVDNFITGFAVTKGLICVGTNMGEVLIFDFNNKILKKYKLDSRVADIRISSDGSNIAIVENEEGSYFKLYQINVDSLEIKNIYATPDGDMRNHVYCKYSPDSKYLVSYGGSPIQGALEVFDAKWVRFCGKNHVLIFVLLWMQASALTVDYWPLRLLTRQLGFGI